MPILTLFDNKFSKHLYFPARKISLGFGVSVLTSFAMMSVQILNLNFNTSCDELITFCVQWKHTVVIIFEL